MSSGFYVQLHLHTCESSRCGVSSGAEMAQACKAAGYSLIVVTDHFFNANINCPHDLPWPEQVQRLMAGYHAAKTEGEKIGLPVLFGWETNNDGPEVLTYGLDDAFLLAHPDVADWDLERYLRETNAAGAFNVHAHPFRQAYYIVPFRPRAQLFEAFETYNAQNHDHAWDEAAQRLARQYGLIELAGSDAHHARHARLGAMELPWPVSDMGGLIQALRSRKSTIIRELPV